MRIKPILITTALSLLLTFGASAVDVVTVTADTVDLRTQHAFDATVITRLQNGTVLALLERGANWSKVFSLGKEGYLPNTTVSFDPNDIPSYKETAYIIASAANIREGATTESEKLATLPYKTQVTLLSTREDWYLVRAGTTIGYIRCDLISSEEPKDNTFGDQVISVAKKYLGTPYRSGGASPSGFDCSGFTMYICKNFGYSLPHSASGQMSAIGTSISRADLQAGDLVFFDCNGGSGRANHVGIYAGNGQMIHAPVPGQSVCYASISSGYFSSRFVGARRLSE